MKLTPLTRTAARWTAGLLVAAGLAAGIGAHPAGADERPPAPTMQSLRLDAPDAYVTFKDNAEDESGFLIVLRERDQPDQMIPVYSTQAVPGAGRVATRTVSGIRPGVAYCATVQTYRSRDFDEVLLDPFAEVYSFDSNAVCADPTRRPPDLALEKIGGREEREWTVVKDQAPAYLVNIRNDGADAIGMVVVDISTSGVAKLADNQSVVLPGWRASGFTCVAKPHVPGSTTGGLRCTGGSLKQGGRTNPAILVRFTGRGYGYIHVSISASDGPAEVNLNNNHEALGIRVY
jgi:hypothetical protein